MLFNTSHMSGEEYSRYAAELNSGSKTMNEITIKPGERGRKKMPFSEACMHIGVAGHEMSFELTTNKYPGVQLIKNGQPYSGTITLGEAGVFGRTDGTFYYRQD